ncbi:MAG: ABC transporter permease subunit [Candidatus Omnitrophota bacterium]
MHTFFSHLKFEFKHFLGSRNKYIFILILGLALAFVQLGVNDYQNYLKQKKVFQEFEQFKVSQFFNYRLYATYGSRMLFMPGAFSALFINSAVVPEITAYIDSGERLNIFNPLIGKNIFGVKKFGFTDFSGILLFFGSLLALFYGYETLYHKEYLKTLASISRRIPLYASLLLSRVLLILLMLLLIIASAFLLMLVNGLGVSLGSGILNFTLSIFLVIVFFFIIGVAVGTAPSRVVGIPILLSSWFLFLFILPAAIDSYIENKSTIIKPLFKLEMEKLRIVLNFEKEALSKKMTFKFGDKPKEAQKELMLSYWSNEFQKLHSLEKDMSVQMRENLSYYQWISIFFPTTNYISAVKEISSRGYENLLDFYDYAQLQKTRFVRSYIDKVFFNNFQKIEPFFKYDDNIYYARSRVPGPFLPGILTSLAYIVALTGITYIRYKKILFHVPVAGGNHRPHPDLKISRGQYRIFSIESSVFLNQLYNLLSEQSDIDDFQRRKRKKSQGSNIKIYIDGNDMSEEKSNTSFLYLCSPQQIPGNMRAVDFFHFIIDLTRYPDEKARLIYDRLNLNNLKKKKIAQLEKQEKAELLLTLTQLHDADIYLLYDIARGMTRIFTVQFKDRMQELSETGKLVLYLTTDTIISEKIFEDNTGFIESTSNWIGMVESVRY